MDEPRDAEQLTWEFGEQPSATRPLTADSLTRLVLEWLLNKDDKALSEEPVIAF
jgi:hypothetical protein